MGNRVKVAAIAIFAAASPAWALAAQDTPQTGQTTDQVATTTSPQPTEKEAKYLKRCEKMTAQHRAQNSKCADLMKKFGIEERERDRMAESMR